MDRHRRLDKTVLWLCVAILVVVIAYIIWDWSHQSWYVWAGLLVFMFAYNVEESIRKLKERVSDLEERVEELESQKFVNTSTSPATQF